MDKAKQLLELRDNESEIVSQLAVNPHEFQVGPSFYEDFALRGIRVDRVEPGMIFCSFKVPPRLIVSFSIYPFDFMSCLVGRKLNYLILVFYFIGSYLNCLN